MNDLHSSINSLDINYANRLKDFLVSGMDYCDIIVGFFFVCTRTEFITGHRKPKIFSLPFSSDCFTSTRIVRVFIPRYFSSELLANPLQESP